ncbi:MAG: hypothetical protein NC211_07140 [Alistipes senegalensis]|nr:hypothetical protein [Oxalobacter formigenes]MCM1281585.1 hypothetical protein [Alistipes senegalensis]
MKLYLSHDCIGLEFEKGSARIYEAQAPLDRSFFMEGLFCTNKEAIGKVDKCLIDFNVAAYSNGRLIFLEAMRLLSNDARLSFYFDWSKFYSKYEFFNFILNYCRCHDIDFSLEEFFPSARGTYYQVHFRKSKGMDNGDGKWSLGILVSKDRSDEFVQFLRSVERAFSSNEENVEVIVNGTLDNMEEILSQCKVPVIFISTGEKWDQYGWITKKKNDIVRKASYQNIAIFHNRYSISENWLSYFEKFGYDFDVLAPKQFYNDEEFPSLPALGTEWSLSTSIIIDNDDYHPYAYVNGGALIAKKRVLEMVPLNDFLFWGECEDVEWSRRLNSLGFVPRLMPFPLAKILTVRPGYTVKAFLKNNTLNARIFGFHTSIALTNPLKRRFPILYKILFFWMGL